MALTKPARSRLLIGCVLGIGLAFLFLWPSALVWGQEPGGRPANLDIILLIDNSWSMSREDPPSDPEGLRIRAARFLVDYLRANAETLGANYRLGVVSFGGVVSDVTPLRLLQDDTVRDSIRAEEIRLTGFRGPLQFALGEFRAKSLDTGNKMAVILFTDGRPHLTDAPMTEQELRDYFGDLAPLVSELQEGGASLFILGIGDAQKDRDNWTQLIPAEHYISIMSATDLANVYRRILADLIGVAVSEGETIPAGRTVPIEVEPYLERIVFSFMKSDPAIHIVLISPAGAVPAPTIGGTADVHHSIYSVTNPDAGEWKALWEGEGEVRYWVDKQYPIIRVEPIESPSLVGQPITITASLVRNNVTVVDSGLDLEAEITLPGGDVVTQALSPIGGGRYSGSHEDVMMDGTYTVTARAFLDGQPLSVRPLPVTVRVFPLPVPPTVAPSPTLSPSATPGVVVEVTATATPPVPTATPPTTSGIVELIRRGGPWLWILLGITIVVVAALVGERIVRFLQMEYAKRKLHLALRSHEYTSASKVIKWVLDCLGRGDANELMIETIESLLARMGPFPLEDRVSKHLVEIEGESPQGVWHKVNAILVDLELGVVGEPERLREEIQACATVLRDELRIEDDFDEINWIAGNYVDQIARPEVKKGVVKEIVRRASIHGERVYQQAKKTISGAVFKILSDDAILDQEKWEYVAECINLSRSPALLHGIAEAFYEERHDDPQALHNILTLADTWISRVNKEPIEGEEEVEAKMRRRRFLPLIEIIWYASVYAAEVNDTMMRDLCQAFSTLFRDIAFQSEDIWAALTNVRRALRHTDAAQLGYKGPIMALCRLCSAFDPYALERSHGVIRFSDDDKVWIREYPGGDEFLRAIEPLQGQNIYERASRAQALRRLKEEMSTLEATGKGETPSFFKELVPALIEVWERRNAGISGDGYADKTEDSIGR